MALQNPTGQPMPLQAGEFKGSAPPNLVTFQLSQVAPPSPIYIQRDDAIAITAVSLQNAEVVNVNGRFLRASDGVVVPFAFNLVMGNLLVAKQFTIQLGEGYLLAINASATQAQRRGQTFVSCSIARGKIALSPTSGMFQVLFQDFCHNNTFTGWPGGAICDALTMPGAANIYSAGNPGAGADFSISTPLNDPKYFALVLYVTATLTTSAAVANRLVNLQVTSVGNIKFGAMAAIAASSTVTLTWAAGSAAYTDALANQHMPLVQSPQSWGSPGNVFCASTTTNIQAGDQWSNISAGVIEWATLL